MKQRTKQLQSGPQDTTLVDLVQDRAALEPDLHGFTFLVDGEAEEAVLTYAELDRRARVIAAALQSEGGANERAVLLYPPGLDYITAFFGCLYAGVVAVPAYPPDPSRIQRTLPRLLSVINDAGAKFVLTSQAIAAMSAGIFAVAPELRSTRWIATDALPGDTGASWHEPDVNTDTLAFLQYTSGSTGTPKGVCLSHKNLLHNSKLIRHGFGLGLGSVGVIWLPPYHDMGLIGGIIQPLFTGFPVVLMSPLAFLQRPMRWLRAVSRYRATVSGGPNFAYDLCARKSTAEERSSIDLHTWDVAFCGAEPIRAATLERFAAAFAASGFRRRAFYPCYGLAEATLIVSGGVKTDEPVVREFSKDALSQGEARAGQGGGAVLLGCGTSLPDQEIVVVDPASSRRCAPGQIGEIWVRGPSVARGYWHRDHETASTFRAHLKDEADDAEGMEFLRTGDLGFFQDKELFITGRRKDLIIIRGRNHLPQDIETTMEQCHSAMRAGCTAAFSVDVEGQERLVVVQEVDKAFMKHEADLRLELQRAAQAARAAIAEAHELAVHRLVFVRPNVIPKTSSGKIQRYACKVAFLDGSLESLFELHEPGRYERPKTNDANSRTKPREGGQNRGDAARDAAPDKREALAPDQEPSALPSELEIAAWLQNSVARVLGVEPRAVDARKPLSAFGLDSLRAVDLQVEIEERFAVAVPISAILRGPTVVELAYDVLAAPPVSHPAVQIGTNDEDNIGEQPVSDGQRALWFLHRLAPHSAAYNVAHAVRIRSQVDAGALRAALQVLVDRHPALRTTFIEQAGEPVQLVHAHAAVSFAVEDVSGRSWDDVRTRLVSEAHRPFDLEQGPLFRVVLYTRAAREHALLVSVHHIVTDFWSLGVLAGELGRAYSAALRDSRADLPPVPLTPSECVRRRTEALAGAEGERAWEYWRERLAGELPVLELPVDRRRPPLQSFRGALHTVRVSTRLARAVRDIARARGATLFTTLLAAYAVLLHRLTGQDDLIIGTPTAGRGHPGFAGVVGYLVNPVPLRIDLSGDPSFTDLLQQVGERVQEALEHGGLPLVRLVERLQRTRDPSRSPLFQTAFALQTPQRGLDPGLAALAVQEEGVVLRLGDDLAVETLAFEQQVAQFDLSLTMAEVGSELVASLEYCSDLFTPDTVARLGERFTVLLDGLVSQPDAPVWRPALLGASERAQILEQWNDPRSEDSAAGRCVHHLLDEQAQRTPDAIAVVEGPEQITYAELKRRSLRLAQRLRTLDVGLDDTVGLHFERSIEAVIGIFGVLYAGGAFLLLDAGQPRERLAAMLDDAGAKVLVTHYKVEADLSDARRPTVTLGERGEDLEGQEAPECEVSPAPGNLAYVIYTSGSTGRPKGVMVSHGSLVQRVLWGQKVPRLTAGDAMLQATAFSFDVALWEIFASLLSGAGARLVLAPAGRLLDTSTLARVLAQHDITIAGFVPSVLELLLEEKEIARCTRLRHVFSGGEALSDRLRERFFERLPNAFLYNFYGPSETTIDATWFPCDPGPGDGPVPIGRPLGYTQAYILDERMQPAPVGVPGELYLGGPGLARGYLGAPGLTAERFVPHPFARAPGARLYRTGDRVRWRSDGNIEFLGRRDDQVKIRGVRVEVREVAAVLRGHAAIRDAAVVAAPRASESTGERLLRALGEIEQMSETEASSLLARSNRPPGSQQHRQ